MNKIAVIFDVDGTIVNNNSYHKNAWDLFCSKYNLSITKEKFEKYMWGKTNEHILQYLFGKDITDEKIKDYATEKEAIYRQLHEATIKPIDGLVNLLEQLRINNIPIGIGSSAPKPNVEFVITKTNIKDYFKVVIDESQVVNGKPDPAIYLKAAKLLDISPENCLVFEDSLIGIEAARRANMKVVCLTTTHSREELSELADLVIDDYTHIDIAKIRLLLEN